MIPIKPLRQVRSICGRLLELLSATQVSNDLVRVVLTDETPQIDPMKGIREFYRNVVQLAYERNGRPVAQRLEEQWAAIEDPQTLPSTSLKFVRGDALSDAEAGFDVRVHYIETGRAREIITLSGGETFIAALSLVLGSVDKFAS